MCYNNYLRKFGAPGPFARRQLYHIFKSLSIVKLNKKNAPQERGAESVILYFFPFHMNVNSRSGLDTPMKVQADCS